MSGRAARVGSGIFLIAAGTLLLLDRFGVPLLVHLWRGWPLLLVGAGLFKLFRQRRGLPSRFAAPERVLLGMVTVVGLLISLFPGISKMQSDTRQPSGRVRPPPPPPPTTALASAKSQLEPGQVLDLEVAGIDIVLDPEGSASAEVRAELMASSGHEGPTTLQFESNEGRLMLRAGGGEHAPGQRRALLRIGAPPGTAFEARVSDGNLSATAMAPARITARNATVELIGSAGASQIDMHYGQLSVAGGDGALVLVTRFTNVDLKGLSGAVTLDAVAGDITMNAISGNLNVRAAQSQIQLIAIGGAVEIDSQEGHVEGVDLAGTVVVRSQGSTLEFNQLAGLITVNNRQGQVNIENANGVALTSEDADVTVAHSGGTCTMTSRRGNLHLEGMLPGARATLEIEDGDVSAQMAAEHNLEIKIRRGDVTLEFGALPAKLDLRTENGRIIPGPVESTAVRTAAHGLSVLTATLHPGASAIVVSGVQSNIRLRD